MAKSGLTVKIKTNIEKNTDRVNDLYIELATSYVTRVVNNFRNEVKKSFHTSKSGEEYFVGGNRAVRSAPGEAPAIDTGRLDKSITAVYPKPTDNPSGAVETRVPYSTRLELTLNRPFMSKKSVANKKTRVYAKRITKQMSVEGRFRPITIGEAK
jgi:hypothetical protein